jgi:hypothetical protein
VECSGVFQLLPRCGGKVCLVDASEESGLNFGRKAVVFIFIILLYAANISQNFRPKKRVKCFFHFADPVRMKAFLGVKIGQNDLWKNIPKKYPLLKTFATLYLDPVISNQCRF